jgi:hypothetical protein
MWGNPLILLIALISAWELELKPDGLVLTVFVNT